MKMVKAIRKQAGTAERAAFNAADPLVAEEMKTLALAFRAQEEGEEEGSDMTFIVKGMCRHGALVHRRKTSDAALQKARELAGNGCYDLHIVTPEGRDYHSSEFGDLPRSQVAQSATRRQARR